MELVKKLSDLIPFLEPYPTWVKWLAGCWTILTATLFLALVFGRPPSAVVKERVLYGHVRNAARAPVPAAIVEVITPSGRTATTSDSEGRFHIDTRNIPTDAVIRIRVTATGHRSYERELDIRQDVTELGEFPLQADGDGIVITTEQADAFVTSLQNTRFAGLPDNPSRDDIYRYLDSVAEDADGLAAVWLDILRDVDSGKTLVAGRIDELRSKYGIEKMPNAPYFARLTSFLSYLKGRDGVQVGPPWAAEVASQVGSLLYEREVGAAALNRYFTSISVAVSANPSAAVDLQALRKSVQNLQLTAANLHALAKTARASGAPRTATPR